MDKILELLNYIYMSLVILFLSVFFGMLFLSVGLFNGVLAILTVALERIENVRRCR